MMDEAVVDDGLGPARWHDSSERTGGGHLAGMAPSSLSLLTQLLQGELSVISEHSLRNNP